MRRKIIAGIVIGLVLVSLAAAMAIKGDTDTAADRQVREQIAVVRIEGPIVSSTPVGFAAGGVAAADQIVDELKQARENPEIRAVVLRLNTGGGTTVGSDEIGQEVERVRKAGKPVVASMGEMAASGGYWISAKADKIVANPSTLTGSIGVIIQITKLKELYEKIGVETTNFTTGPYKDMGATNKEISPEEAKIFQSLIDDSYEEFVKVVAEGRNMDIARAKTLADGRIYSGKQAKEVGLVDELGNFQEAVDLAAKLAKIEGEPNLVEMRGPEGFWRDLLGGIQAQSKLLPIPLEGLLLMPDPSATPRPMSNN